MKINKKLKGLVVAAIVCLAYMPIQATNYTCDVPEGQTMSVSDFGYTFKDGDKLIKTGKGVLTAVNNTTVAYDIDISNGVYHLDSTTRQKGGATLWVRKGATLDITWTSTQLFMGDWNVYMAGDGVGTGDYLGAICVGGTANAMNAIFGTGSKFYLSEAATIYTYGTMNPLFSGSGSTSGPTVYMNSHPLTLRGKNDKAVFRPRQKLTIDKPGPIVVRNGQFSRHKETLDCTANIPCITVTEGGSLQGFTDGAKTIWNKVDAFVFDYGTKIIKGGNGEAANPMTLANVTGPVEISSDEKVTLKGTYTARGSDLAEGHVITSGTTLTFASGCKVKIDDICATAWTKGTPVTIATAMSIAGNPTIDPSQADLFTLTKTATELKVTPTFDVVTLPTTTDYAFAVSNLTAGVEIPPAEAGGTTYLLPIGAKVGIYAVPEEGYAIVGTNPYVIGEVMADTTIDASALPTAQPSCVVTVGDHPNLSAAWTSGDGSETNAVEGAAFRVPNGMTNVRVIFTAESGWEIVGENVVELGTVTEDVVFGGESEYHVPEVAIAETVAIIEDETLGTLRFPTLAAAVAAAKYGSTIIVIGDVTGENVKIPSGMTVRIGPNGQFRPPKAEDLLHDYYKVITNFEGSRVVGYEYLLDADKVAPRVGDDSESGTPWLEFVVDEKTGLVTSAIINIVNAYEDLYYGVDSGLSPTNLTRATKWMPVTERGSLRIAVPAAESGYFYRVRATDHVGGTMPDGSGYRLMAE